MPRSHDSTRICLVDGCGRKCAPALYCKAHQVQRREGLPFTELPRQKRRTSEICAYPDCGRKTESRDHCAQHANMLRRGIELHPVGDPDWNRRRGQASWARLTAEERSARMAGIVGRGHYERTEEWRLRRGRMMAARKMDFADAPRDCVGCGVSFTPNAPRHMWCTKECQRTDARARKYGMTRAALTALMEQQGNRCAICRTVPKVVHLDHDHGTGRVRGFLCSTCNTGLGKFRDDPAMLKRALAYLQSPPI